MFSVRRKSRRIDCPPDSVNLAMRFKIKGIQEQSNTTTRIQCHEINFQNILNLKVCCVECHRNVCCVVLSGSALKKIIYSSYRYIFGIVKKRI